jgi:broad specificity phosphatase PhoE
MFPTVNVELLEDEYWFLKCLRNASLREELISLCKSSHCGDFEALKAWMLSRPGEDGLKPRGFTEVPDEFEERVKEVKQQLKEMSKGVDGRVLVVTHSHIIKSVFENEVI